jgi:multidrug efflux pump subunit AcrA (membrane-fusion protein)
MAGDGGRAPDVSEQRADLAAKIADELAYNDECGPGPVSRREYLDDANAILRIVLSDLASVLAALLAEQPDATIAALETLLTSDEAVEAYARAYEPSTFAGDPSSPYISEALDDARRALKAACRSLLPKAPKEDGDA